FDAVLESVPAAVEIVQAAIHLLHAFHAYERIERVFHLFKIQTQQGNFPVVAALCEDLYGTGQALEIAFQLSHAPGRHAETESPFDILAQGLEFALESHRHLLAQFVAQAAQLLGDLADDSEAFLLSAHPLNVAGDRLVTIWEAVGPHAFLAAWPSLGLPAAGI